jgi:hypothetical protein
MKIFDFNDIQDFSGTAIRQHYTRAIIPRILLPVVVEIYNYIDNFSISLPRQDHSALKNETVHIVFHNNEWGRQGERLKMLWETLDVMNVPIFWRPAASQWRGVHQVKMGKFYLTTAENMV